MKEPLIRLTWHGRQTIETLPTLLRQAEQIEIALPVNYNHALASALFPQAPTSAPEGLDIAGGPEILLKIAGVSGLEQLAALVKPLTEARARIKIVSPPRIVITTLGADRDSERPS